jgi:hypothetical protein
MRKKPLVNGQDTPAAPAPQEPRRHGFRNFLIVVVLLAAAFGAGWYWGEVRLRQASAAWKADRQKLEASLADAAKTLDGMKSAQALWEIDSRLSEADADLADNNFGLARDAAEAARLLLEKAAPGLSPAQTTALAPLQEALKDLSRSAGSLSPDAKARARAALTLLRTTLKKGQ